MPKIVDYIGDNPLLVSEWNCEKNGGTPEETSYQFNKKYFWICSSCHHEWETLVNTRRAGRNCPECGKRKRAKARSLTAAKKNNFKIKFPQIAEEWNHKKNNGLNPEDFSASSNEFVWWSCAACGNEWEATINHRTNGTGCPECAKKERGKKTTQRAAAANNFAVLRKDLVKEWHKTKNGDLKPEDVSLKCNKKVWWQCSFCDNEWQATINDRSSGSGCLRCSKAQTSFAENLVYFYVLKAFPDAIHRYRKEYEFDIYIPSVSTAIEYDGAYYHLKEKVAKRETEKDLYCMENGIKMIRFRSPNLKDTVSSIRITCQEHQLERGIKQLFEILNVENHPNIDIDRDTLEVKKLYRQSIEENSISKKSPRLLKEWHYAKNEGLTPISVPAYANYKVWWLCSLCGFEWQSIPSHRSGGEGCPACSNKAVFPGKTDLATVYPDLIKEWDYEKNSISPTQVACKSNKKYWWKCVKYGHSWETTVTDRTSDQTGCPFCANRKILVGFNDLSTTHPQIAKQWHYEKNGTLTPEKVTYGSSKKVWWICAACGNEWQAVIYSRSAGRGCSICTQNKLKKEK